MKEIFYEILNLSLSAAYLVPVVLVLRLALKKAPRWTACLLWGLVALRLVMPFSLESEVSLHPGREPIADLQTRFETEAQPDTLPEVQPEPLPETPSVTPTPAPAPAEEVDLMEILAWVWLFGACAMAAYGLVSYIRLKIKVRPSLETEKGVFVCDGIGYPFLLGVFRPGVYLPSDLEEPHLSYVLAHEKAHVKRGDHLWKPLGFVLLTIHWFNPLLWVANLLLCRDIEAACDEKVVQDMDNTQKDGYSRALLACSLQGAFHRGYISACPVAFGETGVKSRIKGVLHYKKPAFWVLLVAVLACIAVGVFFLTDPVHNPLYDISLSPEVQEKYDYYALCRPTVVEFFPDTESLDNERGTAIAQAAYEALNIKFKKATGLSSKEELYSVRGNYYWITEESVWLKIEDEKLMPALMEYLYHREDYADMQPKTYGISPDLMTKEEKVTYYAAELHATPHREGEIWVTPVGSDDPLQTIRDVVREFFTQFYDLSESEIDQVIREAQLINLAGSGERYAEHTDRYRIEYVLLEDGSVELICVKIFVDEKDMAEGIYYLNTLEKVRSAYFAVENSFTHYGLSG